MNADRSCILVLCPHPRLHAIEEALSKEGFEVIAPSNWQESIEAMANRDVAVAIVDLELSQIWGPEVLEGLKRWSDKICLIVYTTSRSYESARIAVNLGAVAYIESSDEPKELIIAVHRAMQTYLQRKAASAARAAEGICVYQHILDRPSAVFSVWNDQMTRITGYQLDEINRIGLSQVLFPDQQLRQQALELKEQILQGKDLTDQEGVIVRKDGQQRTVRCSTSGIYGPDGHRHVLVMMRDITDAKAQQRRIMDYQRQLKALASQLTVAEERLRREFATQLHDELSQVVAMAKLRLEGLVQTLETPAKVQLEQIASDLEQALQTARSLTARLSYPALRALGLSKAIEKWLDEEVGQKHRLRTVFVDDQSPKPVDKDVESVLFRSVREVLTNAVKHSKAKRIVVTIQRRQSNIAVIIEDDGVGFDPAAVLPRCSGFGILSIQESLARLGGSIEVESRPGAGCRVVLQAPLSLQMDGQQVTQPAG